MFVLDWWMLPAGADVVQPQPLQLGPENLRVLQQVSLTRGSFTRTRRNEGQHKR